MKETKLYECDFCHTSYKDKSKAEECEKNHKTINKIIDTKYTAFKSDLTGTPNKICIEFKDGTQVWYKK